MQIFVAIANCLAVIVAIPVAVFAIEILASLAKPRTGTPMSDAMRPQVTALIPAHDEAEGIAATLRSVAADLAPNDRLLVVADNCADQTASIAAQFGAEVIQRTDAVRTGKGYALQFGIDFLRTNPPDVLVVIDADCLIELGSISRLASACVASSRPVQALNLMVTPPDVTPHLRLAEFAWRVRNWVRPAGLRNLGLPTQLMGTGMAFPWPLIDTALMPDDSIVEDLKLGLTLARCGHPAIFEPGARVTSSFPSTAHAALIQRTRWESGHLDLIVKVLPRLFGNALVHLNLPLLALVIDASIPPLTVLTLLILAQCVISALVATVGGGVFAAVLSLTTFAVFSAAIFMAWIQFGRDLIPAASAAAIPRYMIGKLPAYLAIISRRRAGWIRTPRDRD